MSAMEDPKLGQLAWVLSELDAALSSPEAQGAIGDLVVPTTQVLALMRASIPKEVVPEPVLAEDGEALRRWWSQATSNIREEAKRELTEQAAELAEMERKFREQEEEVAARENSPELARLGVEEADLEADVSGNAPRAARILEMEREARTLKDSLSGARGRNAEELRAQRDGIIAESRAIDDYLAKLAELEAKVRKVK